MSSDTDRPIIEFPCENYPVKVLGDASDDFQTLVLEVFARHAEICAAPAPAVPSRNGRFVSLTVKIVATGEPQLKRLHEDLKALSWVKLVL